MSHVLSELKKFKAEEDSLKKAIRATFAEKRLPIQDGKSEYLNYADIALRVTQPDDQAPSVDAEKFHDKVGDELFLRLGTVDKYTLDLERWQEALTEEWVTESQLLDCLKGGGARTPMVSVTKAHDGA